jgi:hypothetical protein
MQLKSSCKCVDMGLHVTVSSLISAPVKHGSVIFEVLLHEPRYMLAFFSFSFSFAEHWISSTLGFLTGKECTCIGSEEYCA